MVFWTLFLSHLYWHTSPEHFASLEALVLVSFAFRWNFLQPFHTKSTLINKFDHDLIMVVVYLDIAMCKIQNVTLVTVFSSFHRIFADFETLPGFLWMFLNRFQCDVIQFKIIYFVFPSVKVGFCSIISSRVPELFILPFSKQMMC